MKSKYIKPLPAGWYEYRIMNLMPEVPEGHEFRSSVVDLESHPELWQAECPYSISDQQLDHVWVERNDD